MQLKKTLLQPSILLVALFFFSKAYTQSDKLGTWEVLNGEYYLNNKWNLWAEGQLRSQKVYKDFYYHELKGGVNYKLNKSTIFLLGVGQYGTYSNGGNFKSPVLSHELRLWEQLTLVNNIGRIKIEHRYRVEQRWVNNDYKNRFRYRLNPLIPINKRTIEKGTVFASVYDEIFLTNKGPFFERNRVFAGAGYMISNPLTLLIGCVRQFDYSLSNPGSKKDFIQTTLFFRINQGHNTLPTHPSSMD